MKKVLFITLLVPVLLAVCGTSAATPEWTFVSVGSTPTSLSLSGDVSFTGDYAAVPYDWDQDGQYEALLVTATVVVRGPHTEYWVSGRVLSKNGSIISLTCPDCTIPQSFGIPMGTSGPVKVELLFSGEDIYEHGVDGPYQIELDIGSAGGIFHSSTCFTTAAYLANQFGEYDGRIRSVTDFAEDLNGDSIYEALVVRATVEAFRSGTYVLEGWFYAEPDPVYTSTTKDLTVGTHEIELRFDGTEIQEARSIDLNTVTLNLCKHYNRCWAQDFPLSITVEVGQFSRRGEGNLNMT
jgi:hypothetical protein